MKRFDFNSDKFTDFIKSTELSQGFSYTEKNQSSKEVVLRLHRSTLQVFIQNLIILNVPVDKSFKIKSEDLSKYELKIDCVEDDQMIEFALRSSNLDQHLTWKQAFQVSKRPEIVDLPGCYLCHKGFNIFRRKYHCKNCGNPMCSKCCPFQAVIEFLGYSKKQNLCKECVFGMKEMGGLAHKSLFMEKKKVDKRSVLE